MSAASVVVVVPSG